MSKLALLRGDWLTSKPVFAATSPIAKYSAPFASDALILISMFFIFLEHNL